MGPVIQSPLFNIILRFRKHKFIVVADVEKMYWQILVSEADIYYQKIVPRDNDSQRIRYCKLNTLNYGTDHASSTTTRCLKEAIIQDMYMDNLMTGIDSEDDLF